MDEIDINNLLSNLYAKNKKTGAIRKVDILHIEQKQVYLSDSEPMWGNYSKRGNVTLFIKGV